MRIHALPAVLISAGILGGILAMGYVWRRGSMIPAHLRADYFAGAATAWATGGTLP